MVNLNSEQQLAVNHPMDKSAIIMAGAGSGKSTVLIARLKFLIDSGVEPKRILCCTFTNKAAAELKERLGYDPLDQTGPRVSTIHGLALSAIRKAPKGFGLAEKISPLDSYNQIEMLKDIIYRMNLKEDVKPWELIEKVQYHRARGIGFCSEYTKEVHEKAKYDHSGYHMMGEKELSVWREYEQEKKKQSVVDFDDMLHLVIRRGREDDLFRSRMQKQFLHILVDEAQDLSPVQWGLLDLLVAPDNKNFYMVGDLSQSIYAFNGASPETLYSYSKKWRDEVPVLYKLENNHRSVPQVVKLANAVQKRMTETIPLRMKSFRETLGDKGSVHLMEGETTRVVAEKIASQIYYRNVQIDDKIAYNDTVILVRSASQTREIESELVRARIPYIIKGGQGLLQTEEARDILSYLRLIANPNDLTALSRAISIPKRGIGDATLEKLNKVAIDKNCDLIKAMKIYDHPKMSMFRDTMEDMLNLQTDILRLYDTVLRYTKYDTIIEEKYKNDRDKIEWKKSNVVRIREILESLIDSKPDTTLEDLVFQLTMNDKDSEDDKNKDGKVVISTIHSSKGLEWRVVYLTNMIEGSIPHKYCTLPSECEEEKRLFYVACTRARDYLYICVPHNSFRGNSLITNKPSRFLNEIGIL